MADPRIMVVDDSPFSVAVIRGILENNGYTVVGDAGTMEEVIQVAKETKPTLVTMDMTLPGTDGLECTRAIHAIDPGVKVIVISSMKDDEIVKAARDARVSAYLQKPVDEEELLTAIRRLTEHEELFHELSAVYAETFKEALKDGMNRMTKTLLTYETGNDIQKEFESRGMSIIVGVIGQFSGRLLLDLGRDSASRFVGAIMRGEPRSKEEISAGLAEFTNIIAGNACSLLNKKNKAFGLRVSPPSVLYGDHMLISPPEFPTTSAIAKTEYGEILLNVGFKGA